MVKPDLSPEEVKRMTAGWRTSESSAATQEEAEDPRYRKGEDWHRNKQKMLKNEALIYALALSGMTSEQIAAAFNVSRECIGRRLRVVGATKGRGRPGKSKRSTCSQTRQTVSVFFA